MAQWTVQAQLNTGSLTLGATDRIWFNGIGGAFGTNVIVNMYQDGTHITDSNDTHSSSCSAGNHVHNTKYVDDTHVSIDGASSSLVSAMATNKAPLKWNFSDPASIATFGAKLYAYSTADGSPVSGIIVKAAEAGHSSSWLDIGTGTAAAGLALADQTAATSHDFYTALSVTPTSAGSKTNNTLRLTLTYV